MFCTRARETKLARSPMRANDASASILLMTVLAVTVGLALSGETAAGAFQQPAVGDTKAVENKADEKAGDKPLKIESTEARKHVGTLCEVTFKVQKTKHSEKRKTYFLDSTTDFNLPENLGIKISDEVAAKLRQASNIEDPVTAYKGKTIRVVGKVTQEEERVYIVVEKPEQIEILKETATTPSGEEKPKDASRN